jgi:hypothetical protein
MGCADPAATTGLRPRQPGDEESGNPLSPGGFQRPKERGKLELLHRSALMETGARHHISGTPTDASRTSPAEDTTMSNGSSLSLSELEDRIAITRDNIRQLIEQAAANSGAGDEERNADRIARQNEELERLVKQRDELLKKRQS